MKITSRARGHIREILLTRAALRENSKEKELKKLKKEFSFSNYSDSIAFTNKVADMADQEDHHPQIILEWGKVTVIWWSHKIKGLHKNDFICAAKTDYILI